MRQELETAHPESSAGPNNLSLWVSALVWKKTSSRLEAPTQDTGWDSQRALYCVRTLLPDSSSTLLAANRSPRFLHSKHYFRADGLEPVQ